LSDDLSVLGTVQRCNRQWFRTCKSAIWTGLVDFENVECVSASYKKNQIKPHY